MDLLSVGIDVGTSTTQLVFTRLVVKNMASGFSVPRVEIVEKEVIYRSEIYFTPLLSESHVDAMQLRKLIQSEYQRAGIEKSQVDTGAVIITGETARKENAKEVLDGLSGFAGDFVVATAGPDLESIIAGKGAAADVYSKEHSTCVVNIDIGGGTSNIAVFDQGEVVDTGCLDIGGRLIKVDPQNHKITYIMPKIKQLIDQNGWHLAVGMVATVENIRPVAQCMADILAQSIGMLPRTMPYEQLLTNGKQGIGLHHSIQYISFSGGVADYIYQNKKQDDLFQYGDIGIILGQAIYNSILCSALQIIVSKETIGATVVGAGSHTTKVSGSTITYTSGLFPLKNIPILKLTTQEEDNLGAIIQEKRKWFTEDVIAIGIQGMTNPKFAQIQQYAQGIVQGLADDVAKKRPIVVILQQDMAMVLGQSMATLLPAGYDLICLDGVMVEQGDYIDIGHPIADGLVLPVVVKTIIFNR